MSMSFKDLMDGITYNDGQLMHRGKRIVIVPFSWLINLQKEIENILGSEGAYVLIRNAAYRGGDEFGRDLLRLFGGLPIEHKIRAYLDISSVSGWGKFTLQKLQLDPLEVVIKYEHSYVEGHYENEPEPKCFYFTTMAAVIEQFLKHEGINYDIEAVETMCVAKGDPYCEFVFRKVQ